MGKCLCLVLKACADKETGELRKVCTPRSKSLCRKAKVCIPRSLRRQTNKGKCVSLVLKACADKQTGEVCTPRSKRPCRKAKVCIPRSLHRRTNKGKCVSLVLKACADEQTGEVCIARCKSFQRADLHGTIFVAYILKHVLKCCDNRKTCRRPVVRLSHATKIVPCKSALSQPVPAYKDALLHRNYKHCFSNEHFTVPKYNILHSSSSVKSINLTNIPTPRQLLQKNYLIRSPTSKSLTTLLCKRAAVRIELFHRKPE